MFEVFRTEKNLQLAPHIPHYHIEPTSKGGSKSERTRRRAERKTRLPPSEIILSLNDERSLADKSGSCPAKANEAYDVCQASPITVDDLWREEPMNAHFLRSWLVKVWILVILAPGIRETDHLVMAGCSRKIFEPTHPTRGL